jgi:hypothetical protein
MGSMEDAKARAGGMSMAIDVGLVVAVLSGIIVLVIEYKSGYFQSVSVGPRERMSERQEPSVGNARDIMPTPKTKTPFQAAGDSKSSPSKQGQPEPQQLQSRKSQPSFANVTLEHFAATYSSLGPNDRPTYLGTIAGKRITWTGYISQIYLRDNYFYLSNHRDMPGDVHVSVNVKDEMRLGLGPLHAKIQVTGIVEIRQEWVIIDATELTLIR